MRFIIGIGLVLVLFAAVVSLVIGGGALIGAGLHWLMPSLDFGLAIIVGLLSILVSAHMVTLGVQFVASMSKTQDDQEEDESEDEEDEAQAELVAQHLADELFNRVDLPYSTGRRRRK